MDIALIQDLEHLLRCDRSIQPSSLLLLRHFDNIFQFDRAYIEMSFKDRCFYQKFRLGISIPLIVQRHKIKKQGILLVLLLLVHMCTQLGIVDSCLSLILVHKYQLDNLVT